MKYKCNKCEREFEIPGTLESHTVTNYIPAVYPALAVAPTPSVTVIIKKKICPYCHELDFHDLSLYTTKQK